MEGASLVMETYTTLTIDEERFVFMVEQLADMDCLDLADGQGQTVTHLATQYLDLVHIEKLVNAGRTL